MSTSNDGNIENLLKALAEAVKPFLGLPNIEEEIAHLGDIESLVEDTITGMDLYDPISDALQRVLASGGILEDAINDLGVMTEDSMDDYVSNEDIVNGYNITDYLEDYVTTSDIREYVNEEIDSYFSEDGSTLKDMIVRALLPEDVFTYNSTTHTVKRKEVEEHFTVKVTDDEEVTV